MHAETVRIDDLHLRVPGLSVEEARQMGEEVARRVAEALPVHGRKERLGVLDLRLSIPYGTPRDRLAALIARAILEKVG
jgi:hypothetical protein